MKLGRALLAVSVAAVVAAGCGGGRPAPSLSSVTLPPAEVAPPSEGRIALAGEELTFTATCYDAGAGDVVVLGAGAADGRSFEVLVQAFFGDAYLVIAWEDGSRVEPALDAPIELVSDAGEVRGEGIRFVSGLDLTGGPATDVGVGSVTVTCGGYVRGLPDGYAGTLEEGAAGS